MATNHKNAFKTDDNSGVLLAGAAGFGLGLLAAATRKAVVQAPTYAAGDWFEGLKAEHKIALGLVEVMEKTTDEDVKKRGALLFELAHALGRHNVQEEDVVYCAMRMNGEVAGADELGHEHNADIKQGLYELEQMNNGSAGWLPRLAELKADLVAHFDKEENEFYPALRAKLSDTQNKELTGRMNREGFKVA